MLEIVIGILLAAPIGFLFGCLFMKQHKTELLYQITCIKEDVFNLTAKVEQTLKSMQKA